MLSLSHAARSKLHHRTDKKNSIKKTARSMQSNVVTTPTLAPRLKNVSPWIHQLIFGKGMSFPSQAALNRHNLHQRYLGELVQNNQFEEILDASPVKRYKNHSAPGFKTRRYDKKPFNTIVSRIESRSTSEERSIVSMAKSRLSEDGKLVPVGTLPAEIWNEDIPFQLANLIYAHVYSTNKLRAIAQVPVDAGDDQIEQLILNLEAEISEKLSSGSPCTSTTSNPVMSAELESWGEPGKYIEVDANNVNILSPSYLTALILFAAFDIKINEPAINKWRIKYESNPAEVLRMESLLIQHGIEPDGQWTNRDRCAYLALLADEYTLIGTTPLNTAKNVKY